MAKTEKGTLSASFEYSGMSDYWGGNGRRWDDNAGCLFTSYSHDTTLRDIIDGLVDDFNAGGDCDDMDDSVTGEDVRAALIEMLSDQGRADYNSGAICEFAADFAACNDADDIDDLQEYPVVIVLIEFEADPDGWTLYHGDDELWGWAHEDGRDVGGFPTELDAWENAPEGVERAEHA